MNITVNEKFLGRQVTRKEAIHEFLDGKEVIAIAKDGERIIAIQVFMPKYHGLQEIKNRDFEDAEWYLQNEVQDESTAYGTDCRKVSCET